MEKDKNKQKTDKWGEQREGRIKTHNHRKISLEKVPCHPLVPDEGCLVLKEAQPSPHRPGSELRAHRSPEQLVIVAQAMLS